VRTLQFNLLRNAEDSLTHAVHLLAWPDGPGSEKLKQAILSISHCVELLLKERLRRIHPAFLWENVDKYPSLTARTVSSERAISRLEAVAGLRFRIEDKNALAACRSMRNAIEHYEFEVTEKEAKLIVARVLSFVFSFSASELGCKLDANFKNDDTWQMLLDELYEFANEYGNRISASLWAKGSEIVTCSYCGQDTVDSPLGFCSLCGHYYDRESSND